MTPTKVKNADMTSPGKADGQPVGKVGAKARPLTRIQREKQDVILEAALEVFAVHGFRGSTIDQIADVAGMSKPNLLYYFSRKEEIHHGGGRYAHQRDDHSQWCLCFERFAWKSVLFHLGTLSSKKFAPGSLT